MPKRIQTKMKRHDSISICCYGILFPTDKDVSFPKEREAAHQNVESPTFLLISLDAYQSIMDVDKFVETDDEVKDFSLLAKKLTVYLPYNRQR